MEGKSQRLRQSSDDLEDTRETKSILFGLERILVWVYRKQDCQTYAVYGWEVDNDLTNKRNGCTFEEAKEKYWKGLKFV